MCPYSAMLKLTTHLNRFDPLSLASAAVFLLWCLDKSGYLRDLDPEAEDRLKERFGDDDPRSDKRVFFCYLLLRINAAAGSNNHAFQGKFSKKINSNINSWHLQCLNL